VRARLRGLRAALLSAPLAFGQFARVILLELAAAEVY
jgi:hypothetical protein|tara:strand:- start:1358 stop:1468 length:111 start_codon:yes stop_codon:yes gene_type:complete